MQPLTSDQQSVCTQHVIPQSRRRREVEEEENEEEEGENEEEEEEERRRRRSSPGLFTEMLSLHFDGIY